jgi:cytochrome c-type biogenesis protein CcmH/NrfG
MSDETLTERKLAGWKPAHSYLIAAMCLLLGLAGGYLAHDLSSRSAANPGAGLQSSSKAGTGAMNQMPPVNAGPDSANEASPAGAAAASQMTPQELQQALGQQLPPLMERLKSDPKNVEILATIGNLYFDARQYREATTYYGRALQIDPRNTSVRTDLGNSYFYLGNADRAITEFQTVLKTEPNQANALFGLGVVEWRGKMDAKAAVASWQKLLDTNPTFERRDMVARMITQAKQHIGIQPGTKTDRPAM